MCGIAGFFSTHPLDNNARHLTEQMVATLYHRGPDGTGFHIDTESGIAMGHTRLSIIDLETGDQPLYGNSRGQILTVNGEFYDYKRIRGELNCQGYRFRTKSDSEIALHLYEKHGLDFVEHLRGEFAFALYDCYLDRLILVRDRFGIKPLYYYIKDGTVYYASEIKALLAHPDIPRKLSSKALLNQLMHTMVPGTSAFEDIYAVKPGHMLIFTRRGDTFDFKEHRYWDMNFPTNKDRESDSEKSEDSYIQLVQEKLMESVRFRLEADVPVGCYLSGGIDSCSMLGLASAAQQSPVKAFTISFDHDSYDEADIAREMAARVQADHEILNLTAEDLYGDNYRTTAWHAERTFYNTLGVAKWCMSRRVHECGYKVVVTGEGADELFGGYPAFKLDMFKHGLTDSDLEESAAFREALDQSNKLFKGAILAEEDISHPAFDNLCGFTPSWLQPWMLTLKMARPLLHDDILDELEDYDPIAAIAETLDPGQIRGRHALDIAQYTWIKTMLEGQILNWGGDRVDMANAMESRPAFLDHNVAELARTIPPRLRINGNIEKWVLRVAMRNILPDRLYRREKFAFMAPPGHTGESKKNALQELLDEHMNRDRIIEAGLFDPTRLEKFISEYKNDTDPVSLTRKDALVNHLLCLHLIYQQLIMGQEAPAAFRATG